MKKLNCIKHLRSILIASVEDHERVRLAKEVLLVQLVGTELHSGTVLQKCMEMWGRERWIKEGEWYHEFFTIKE